MRPSGAQASARGRPAPGSAQRPPAARKTSPLDYLIQNCTDPLTAAFPSRQFILPWQGCTPVPEPEAAATLERVFGTPRNEPAVAYVHVPYCQNHCLFCGFFQNVWRPEASSAFVDDVIAELERLADTPLVSSAPVEAIYIGGGTPSALAADDLARLVSALRRYLPVSPDCEITVEGRAFDFGLAKAQAALDAGANRISLGIQTFDTAVRRRLGRKTTGEEARAFLADLLALNRAPIGCDLIYGLPGQDHTVWRADIDTVSELGLDGVSLYALNIWPGGPLATAIGGGKLGPAAELPFQARAYSAASEMLTARNWRQISQAHFVSSARERNLYNRLVKAGANCLAFGPGAGGLAHGHRWRNVIDAEHRSALVAQGKMPIEGLSRMPRDHRARAAITAGLEAGLLDLAAVENEAPGFSGAAASLFENWTQTGLGNLDAGRFRTSRAGAFWITNLTNGLLAVLDQLAPGQTLEGQSA
jgi:oxygen-independent coproporphyrinogen-3 oxidase